MELRDELPDEIPGDAEHIRYLTLRYDSRTEHFMEAYTKFVSGLSESEQDEGIVDPRFFLHHMGKTIYGMKNGMDDPEVVTDLVERLKQDYGIAEMVMDENNMYKLTPQGAALTLEEMVGVNPKKITQEDLTGMRTVFLASASYLANKGEVEGVEDIKDKYTRMITDFEFGECIETETKGFLGFGKKKQKNYFMNKEDEEFFKGAKYRAMVVQTIQQSIQQYVENGGDLKSTVDKCKALDEEIDVDQFGTILKENRVQYLFNEMKGFENGESHKHQDLNGYNRFTELEDDLNTLVVDGEPTAKAELDVVLSETKFYFMQELFGNDNLSEDLRDQALGKMQDALYDGAKSAVAIGNLKVAQGFAQTLLDVSREYKEKLDETDESIEAMKQVINGLLKLGAQKRRERSHYSRMYKK